MKNTFTKARFLLSAANTRDFPADQGAEIAFCGRSNAGKSSAINTLCRQNNLARTSKTPGRTQLINFFKLDADTRLVDLPGYGFAKAPQNVQKKWHMLMESYLLQRKSLSGLVLLMDIRHPLTDIDWTMINWSNHYQLPIYILLTKADKLSKNQRIKNLTKVVSSLEQKGFDIGVQIFSASKKIGLKQAEEKVCSWIENALISQSEKSPG